MLVRHECMARARIPTGAVLRLVPAFPIGFAQRSMQQEWSPWFSNASLPAQLATTSTTPVLVAAASTAPQSLEPSRTVLPPVGVCADSAQPLRAVCAFTDGRPWLPANGSKCSAQGMFCNASATYGGGCDRLRMRVLCPRGVAFAADATAAPAIAATGMLEGAALLSIWLGASVDAFGPAERERYRAALANRYGITPSRLVILSVSAATGSRRAAGGLYSEQAILPATARAGAGEKSAREVAEALRTDLEAGTAPIDYEARLLSIVLPADTVLVAVGAMPVGRAVGPVAQEAPAGLPIVIPLAATGAVLGAIALLVLFYVYRSKSRSGKPNAAESKLPVDPRAAAAVEIADVGAPALPLARARDGLPIAHALTSVAVTGLHEPAPAAPMGGASCDYVNGHRAQPNGASSASDVREVTDEPRPTISAAFLQAAMESLRGLGEEEKSADRQAEWWANFKTGKVGAGIDTSMAATRLPFHSGTPVLKPPSRALDGAQSGVEWAEHSQPSVLSADDEFARDHRPLPLAVTSMPRPQASQLPRPGAPVYLQELYAARRSGDASLAPLPGHSPPLDRFAGPSFTHRPSPRQVAAPAPPLRRDSTNGPAGAMRLCDVPVVHGAQWDVEWAAQSQPPALPLGSEGLRRQPDPMAPQHRVHLGLAPQHRSGDGRQFQVTLASAETFPTYVPQQRRPGVTPVWPTGSGRMAQTGDSAADFIFT